MLKASALGWKNLPTTDLTDCRPADGRQVVFEWRLDPDTDEQQASRVADALRRDGGEAHIRPRPKGVLPLTIPLVIFGVVGLVALAEQVIDWWTHRARSGLMIHVGPDRKVDVRPINIPYGKVIFVGADGKTFQYVDVSSNQMKDLLEAASHGITPTGGAPVSN
jgi:hypothetical protein